MTAPLTGQRPELLAAAIDAMTDAVAVFEPGSPSAPAVTNAAFARLVDEGRMAGVAVVEDVTSRIARLEPGGAARYTLTVPAAADERDGALHLDCRLANDTARGAWVWWASDVTKARRAQQDKDDAAAVAAEREEELTRSNEDLERFASIASHDLSEPLRMVASFADLLARRYRGSLDEQADAYIGFIMDGASRMRALIDALLAFAELRASEHRREDVDLAALMEEVLDNLQVAITESGAQVEVEPLPVVRADREAMRQVFQNLIANAVKFRGVDAPQVTVTCSREGGDWVLAVADNGIGVPDEHRERIFDMFGRLHPRAAYPGSGMGLAMSRRAVELHGGRIWADGAPAGGTVFRFTLPTE